MLTEMENIDHPERKQCFIDHVYCVLVPLAQVASYLLPDLVTISDFRNHLAKRTIYPHKGSHQ
jgi:hypothetical protein